MTSLRRLRTVAVTVLMTAGLGVATAPTASAAPTCEYFTDLPARVTIDRPTVRVPLTLQGCAGYLDWAAADVYGPAGLNDIVMWDGVRTEYWYLYDWDTLPGVYDTNDGTGYATGGLDATWRGDSTVVRYGTRAGVSAARSGNRVTVTAAATRYSSSTSTHIPYGNRVVAIQHCLTQTGACSVAAYATTNAAGRATVTLNAPAARWYRVTFGDTGSFWGATSGRVLR
jgi:hypothetical protein